MSAIATEAHPLQPFVNASSTLLDYYCKDLMAIPEELANTSPMGEARSPLAITQEIIGVNHAAAAILRGEPTMSEENAIERFGHIKTREQAVQELRESFRVLNEAGLSLEASDLGTEVTAPWGQPVTKSFLFIAMGYHLNYHDGQLNYFQCLHGDCGYHWHD